MCWNSISHRLVWASMVTYGETKKITNQWADRNKLSSSRSQFYVILVFLWYSVDFYKTFLRLLRVVWERFHLSHYVGHQNVGKSFFYTNLACSSVKSFEKLSFYKLNEKCSVFFRIFSMIITRKSFEKSSCCKLQYEKLKDWIELYQKKLTTLICVG